MKGRLKKMDQIGRELDNKEDLSLDIRRYYLNYHSR